jgi:hypothetical protein
MLSLCPVDFIPAQYEISKVRACSIGPETPVRRRERGAERQGGGGEGGVENLCGQYVLIVTFDSINEYGYGTCAKKNEQ